MIRILALTAAASSLMADVMEPSSVLERMGESPLPPHIISLNELFSSRSFIPASHYEVTLDLRDLPSLMEKLGFPLGMLPITDASLAISNGNAKQLASYAPLIAQLMHFTKAQHKQPTHPEEVIGQSPSIIDPDDPQGDVYATFPEHSISSQHGFIQQLKEELRDTASRLTPFHIRPIYLSLTLADAKAHDIARAMRSMPVKHMTAIEHHGVQGWELNNDSILAELPRELHDILRPLMQKEPTIFFLPVAERQLLIIVGMGTDALDLKLSSEALQTGTVSTASLDLRLNMNIEQNVSEELLREMPQALFRSFAQHCKTTSAYSSGLSSQYKQLLLDIIHTIDDALPTYLPLINGKTTLQAWTDDDSLYAHLSTSMGNYRLEESPPIAFSLLDTPETLFYWEISPLQQDSLQACARITSSCRFYKMMRQHHSGQNPDQQGNLKDLYQDTLQALPMLLSGFTGNMGCYSAQNPEKNVFFAGVRNESMIRSASSVLAQRYASGRGIAKKKNLAFHVNAEVFTMGNSIALTQSVEKAALSYPAAPTQRGGYFYMSKQMLEELACPFGAIDQIYMRLIQQDEKNDLYFRAIFEE